MKIVADHQIPYIQQVFSDFGEIILCGGREITPQRVRDADILLIRSVTRINADLLSGSNVRFVASATSGIDHVDIEYLKQHQIGFAYAPGCNAQSVVEYVLSSLFVLANQKDFQLLDKVVGIIGCGQVGSRLLESLRLIGVKCMVNDPPLRDKTGDAIYRDLEETLTADIITMHVPLTDNGPYPTRQLVNESFLSKINPQGILINTSRGGVIDESLLKKFLKSHDDFSVVLDVWENEPDIDRKLLARIDIGTPHIAGYSTDGKIRATDMIYQEAGKFFNHGLLPRPRVEISGIGRQDLKIAEDVCDPDAMQMAVLAHYDVRSDSAALRRILEISEEQSGYYFDDLRRNYPVRREFPATTINVSPRKHTLSHKLKLLGFNVVFID
ncbi:MAG: 4-phosphoerythronate dehydrogenase [Gammaproteobacteria bacterium]|nr:4-phosphoerythronate dehydrogenase [Gammaproteobacteria bacterium]